jgi:hypothetical protein
MGIEITVNASGPVFDGMAEMEVERYARHVEDVLGEDGQARIRAYLPTQYMYLGHSGGDPRHNPVPPNAGALAASVIPERQVADRVVIRGDRVTYGAWIEGIDDKNFVTNPERLERGLSGRFPGYHTFRIITQTLNDEAEAIALRELPPYLHAMNS